MQLKVWETRFIFLALIILCGIVFAKMALFPLYNTKDSLENSNKQILINIEKLKKIELDRSQQNYNKEDQNLTIMIPTEPQLSQLYKYIDQAAEESGVLLLGAYFTEQEKKADPNNYAKKTFNLTAQGSFNNLMLLIKAIEANPRLLVINSISLTRQMKLAKTKSPDINNDKSEVQLDSIIKSTSNPQGQDMAAPITEENTTTYKTEMQINYFYLLEPELKLGISEE